MLLLALFIISLPILLGYLIYRVIKLYINLKFAIIFVSLYGLFLISVVLSQIYEDELFFKSDAIELVEDLNFGLNDDFNIQENSSHEGMESMTHKFVLEISEKDQNRLTNEIKSSRNFMPYSVYSKTNLVYPDRYKGKKVVWNYENDEFYVREYFQPNGDNHWPKKKEFLFQRFQMN